MIAAIALGFRHAADRPSLFANLSFSLARGQTLVLLGRNGRGKTTLLKCLAGLIKPTAGEVRCAGVVGYVPQHFAPVFSYTVLEVVLMGRARHVGLFSGPSGIDRARAHNALEQLGLAALARRSVMTLSGGERQLVLIARALAFEADVLLLDEPASALDFRNQAVVLSTLRRLAAERNLTIVMTTHEPSHALEIADRAVLLHAAGRAEEGAVGDILTAAKLSALYDMPMKRLDDRSETGASSHIVADFRAIARA